MSNYATKSDLKNATDVDTCQSDLANLKSEVDKLDINKFGKMPSSLNSLKSKVDKLDFDNLKLVPVD